jgi:hypothetical protein
MRPARPAGADNYLRWRRTIDEHLELRRLTWHEYAMFSWLCTKASPQDGVVRASWPTLAEQTSLRPNHVEKLCRSLRNKGYIGYPEHRGKRRVLVEVVIDKFPLADGTYTTLRQRRGGGAAEAPTEVPADVPAEVTAELGVQRPGKSMTSLGGRSRERERNRSSHRVRSADASTGASITDLSKSEACLGRAESLEAAPRALRETVELYWLKMGRDGLTADDLAALRDLDQAHTPAVIQKAITETVERFERRGDGPGGLTFRYVWDSLRRFTTRKTRAATPPHPEHPVYPPGLTRLD